MFRIFRKKSEQSQNNFKALNSSLRTRTLAEKLIHSPENFTLTKAIDVAFSISNCVKVKANVNYSSQYCDLNKIDGLAEGVIDIYTNVLSIAGLDGSLPDPYVENFITYGNKNSKEAISDFFDIFNNRIISLRYKFMKRHDISSYSSKIKQTVIGEILFNLSGLEENALNNTKIIDQFKVSAQSFFWRNTRSAYGLERVLSGYFSISIKVEQFKGCFIQVHDSIRSQIGTKKNQYNLLSKNLILGNKIWDSKKVVNIIVGPLHLKDYEKFLPKQNSLDQKSSQLQIMKDIIKSYVPFGTIVNIFFYLDDTNNINTTSLNGILRLNKDAFLGGDHKKNFTGAFFTERIE